MPSCLSGRTTENGRDGLDMTNDERVGCELADMGIGREGGEDENETEDQGEGGGDELMDDDDDEKIEARDDENGDMTPPEE